MDISPPPPPSSQNLYCTLGLRSGATPKQIKQAYLRLCKELHPDRSGSTDASQFQAVSRAYDTLSDPIKRHTYDAQQYRKRLRPGDAENLGSNDDGGHSSLSSVEPNITPIKITTTVSLKDAYLAKELKVLFFRKKECQECSGLGSNRHKVCTMCAGEKWVYPDLDPTTTILCPTCGGKGVFPCDKKIKLHKDATPTSSQCLHCQGQGFMTEEISLEFPFSTDTDGSSSSSKHIYAFPEKGDMRLGAKTAGTVIVRVLIEPAEGNYRYGGNGTPLTFIQSVRLSDALEGRAGTLTTLDGRTIAIPRSKERGPIQHGEDVWIQGEGMHGDATAWLRVIFQVKLPVLTQTRTQMIRQWETESEERWSFLYGRPGITHLPSSSC